MDRASGSPAQPSPDQPDPTPSQYWTIRWTAAPSSPTPSVAQLGSFWRKMHPPLTIYKHPMCAEIIEMFLKCHSDHPIGKFFGECTQLKIKLDHCFRQEKVEKRKKNLEKSRKLRETLQAYRKATAQETNE